MEKIILLVDDEPTSIEVLSLFLKRADYQYEVAADGEQAWQLLQLHPQRYSLVIADRIMPRLHGVELLRRMRDQPPFNEIPVIIQTGVADKEERIEALKEGAFDLIFKPLDKDLFLGVVKRALRLWELV